MIGKHTQGSEFLRRMVDRRAGSGTDALQRPSYVRLFGT
jgi:hypothetical protein